MNSYAAQTWAAALVTKKPPLFEEANVAVQHLLEPLHELHLRSWAADFELRDPFDRLKVLELGQQAVEIERPVVEHLDEADCERLHPLAMSRLAHRPLRPGRGASASAAGPDDTIPPHTVRKPLGGHVSTPSGDTPFGGSARRHTMASTYIRWRSNMSRGTGFECMSAGCLPHRLCEPAPAPSIVSLAHPEK